MRDMKKNHYVGWEINLHEIKMKAKMFGEHMIIFLIAQVGAAYLLLHFMTSSDEWSLAWRYLISKLTIPFFMNLHFNIPGLEHSVTARELLAVPSVAAVARNVTHKFWLAFVFSFATWALYPVFMRWNKKRADAELSEKHIRGMELIPENDLAKSTAGGKGILPFGKILLPRPYESEHIFISGKTRVGKSVMFKQQVGAVRSHKLRAALADFKGEYTELFYRPETDFILNPLDARGANWNIFSEIEDKADLNALCDSLIPDSQGDDRFWSAAAKAVFRGILAGLYNKNQRTNTDIWNACTAPIQEIAELIKSTPSGQAGYAYIQDAGSKQALGVIAVMMSYISWLEFAQGSTGPEISTSKFLTAPDSFLFLTACPKVESTIRPMTGLFVDLLCRRILSLNDDEHNPARKTYINIDELRNLQKLPSIIKFATAAASKGGVLTIATQDFAGIRKIYGREDAETLFNNCGTTAILNVSDPETASYFSKRFGEREYEYARKNYSMGAEDSADKQTVSRDEKKSELIMPSEIQGLPKLKAYLKIPEHNPALINIEIKQINNQKPQAEAFVMRSGLDLDYIVETQQQIEETAKSWKTKTQRAEEISTDAAPQASEQNETERADQEQQQEDQRRRAAIDQETDALF